MSKRLNELVTRYEAMIAGRGDSHYFDTDEIVEIAEHYESDNRFGEALAAIEFGLKLHPNNDTLQLKQARCLLFLNRVDEARAIMAIVLNNGVEATLIRAELQYFDQHPEEGHRLLLTLLTHKEVWEEECFDALDIYVNYNHFEGLEEFVNRAESVLPDSRGLLREVASIYEERVELSQAAAIYNRLLDKDPYSQLDWFSLAKVEAMAKNYDRALEACDFALAIQENDESVLLFKGYCYYDSGQYQQAIDQFLECVEVTHHKAVAYELIGECYLKMEEPSHALEYFYKALELDPTNANLCYQIATCYYDLGDIPQAIISLNDTLQLDELDDEAHSFLGEILLQQGNHQEAYVHLTRSLELNREDEETLRLLCDACVQLDRFDEAIPLLESVLQRSPYDLNARFNLTVAYAQQGHIEMAEQQIAIIDAQTQTYQENPQLSETDKLQWNKVQDMLLSLKKLLLDNLGEGK